MTRSSKDAPASVIPACHAGPGRPRGFDVAAAIDAGVMLFRRVGFEATSLEDLTEAMGIGRSSFYAAFGSKRGVLLAALERYSAQRLQVLSATATGPAGIEGLLMALAGADGDADGCLLVNCVAELCPGDPEVSALAAEHIARIETIVAEALPSAAGDPARALVAFALGAQTLRKSGVDREAIAALVRFVIPRLDPPG
jgi:TetR/AcrR family transcriptional regulator, transcriptional repressor for nem operon